MCGQEKEMLDLLPYFQVSVKIIAGNAQVLSHSCAVFYSTCSLFHMIYDHSCISMFTFFNPFFQPCIF